MPTDRPQPSFVLVRPQMGENIGAAARAMWNFGLDRMRLVAPRDGWPNRSAGKMAAGAGRLLDEALLCDDLAGAISDCHYVYATTARRRDLTTPVFSPEAAMQDAARRIGEGQKVAVLFGPERTGLENDDIIQASATITVPVNPEFSSLNLAQCVLLTSYEWRRAEDAVPPLQVHLHNTEWATQTEIDALATHYDQRMQEAGLFFPEHKAESMRQTMRSLWSRMPLTQADTRLLHGIMRQMVRWKDHGGGGA